MQGGEARLEIGDEEQYILQAVIKSNTKCYQKQVVPVTLLYKNRLKWLLFVKNLEQDIILRYL
jgi:hypothetical protein